MLLVEPKLPNISSINLLSKINDLRAEFGEPQIRQNKFSEKIESELEGENYTKSVVKNPNGTESYVYALTEDQAMLIGMRESKVIRRNILEWIKSKSNPQLPQSFSEALQLAADQAKQLELQAPMVEVYDKLANRKNDVSTTTLAKQLGVSAIKLNKWLKVNGYKCLFKDYPAAKYAEWFNVVSDVSAVGHEFTQCLITPKGQIEIAKRYDK